MILYFTFWLGFFLLLYHIVMYPAILWIVNSFRKNKETTEPFLPEELPSITVICPAYNEEKHIEAKIKSFLALDYPADKIKMIVISDDSTDGTNEIVRHYTDGNVELVIQTPRGGKQRAHNLVEPTIDTDFVLSTDANSLFEAEAVKELLEVMLSDTRNGIVSGELKLVKNGSGDSGEGLYWKYECFIKKMDSAFASIIGSNGSIYLIRRELFGQIHPSSIDDFERTLHVLSEGFKAVYAPLAVVTEEVTQQAQEEIRRKIRIITREWFSLGRYPQLLNPFRFGRISLILFSHKLLRWMFFLYLLMMLISSAFLQTPFYEFAFALQLVFYLIGITGLAAHKLNKHVPGLSLVSYITAMGWASLVAFYNYIFKVNLQTWNPIRRQGN
ncbi:MAG: glycosyltransferase family 2 protein [Candidatus Cloacimonadaceae bacterium]